MTWPFENDTSAIVKKLAGRSMQADKRNKAFLLLTIAISVCMVFSILLISTGTQEKFKNTQRNKAQIGILGVTDEQTAQLHQNENITWVGEYSAIGVFYVENKTITVAYGNEDYFLHQEEKTFQGSVPQKADEIMLPQNYLDFLGKSYQTGDTISIDLTGTGQKAEYTLSGVLNNTKESNGYFIYVSKELAQDLAMVDFQNRKREFGLLEAVGVTRKQLKAMLNREIGIYLGGSLAISLICGSIFSVIVCRRLDAINHCITLKLPWFFLLALICVLLVIYLVFSMYSKMELKKASILSAIKSE